MWKITNLPTSGTPNSQRSSTSTTTVPSTAKTSPQKPPSTPPTPFLRSRSEVRFALDSDSPVDSEGENRVQPLPPSIAQPSPSPNNVHFSPNPEHCYRAVDTPPPPNPSNIRFAADPNDCYRLAPRQFRLPTHPNEREDGASIPLRGQYVTVLTDDPDDEDLINDPPPGFDDDRSTAMRQFAWAYVKGLGGLVMGVVDGLARGTGGDGARATYLTYGAVAYEGRGR